MRAATTAAAATAAAACPDRVRSHGDLGGSSGLGNPWCPNGSVRCATLARWAAASGVSLPASLSTCSRSPGGMAAVDRTASGATPASRAGVSTRFFRSAHVGQFSMWRLTRLRIRTVSCPSQSVSMVSSAAQSCRPDRATSSAPSDISSWSRARAQQRVHVITGDAEHGRDLGRVEALPQLQLDQVLLAGVQAAHRRPQQRPQFLALASPLTSAEISVTSGISSSGVLTWFARARRRRWHSLRATA